MFHCVCVHVCVCGCDGSVQCSAVGLISTSKREDVNSFMLLLTDVCIYTFIYFWARGGVAFNIRQLKMCVFLRACVCWRVGGGDMRRTICSKGQC